MLILQASEEQENTFNKLIQTMGEQIVWEGRFIVRDNELILEGAVRSLFFQFETKKVVTNLIDLPVVEDQILEVSRHPKLKDLINMVLYAFGKWGTLRGLRVEQDYPQLNQLFSRILSMYYIEPSFRKENFRFYKVGVRITYEEVLQTVLEFEKKLDEDPVAESQGLWHTLIWKKRQRSFQKAETTLEERSKNRIGNNFYLVGYQCPKCSCKLHMAVYPDGKEVRIDTEEKGVYLARAYTCDSCNCFYTPRPDRLIAEGLIYEMAFGDDKKAYEDYMELLGRNAERTANFKYNEYEAVRKQRLQRELKGDTDGKNSPDFLRGPQDALKQMEDFSKRFASLPDEVFRRFEHRVEEGFYPDAVVARHEKKILEQVRERNARDAQRRVSKTDTNGPDDKNRMEGTRAGQQGRNGAQMRPDTGQQGSATAKMPSDGQQGSAASQVNTPLQSSIGGKNGVPQDMAAGQMNQHQGSTAGQMSQLQGSTARQMSQLQGSTAGQMSQLQGSAVGQMNQQDRAAGQMSQPYGTAAGQMNRQDRAEKQMDQQGHTGHMQQDGNENGIQTNSNSSGSPLHTKNAESENTLSEPVQRYLARMGVLERLSDRQRMDLKRQIKNDASLDEYEKNALNTKIAELEFNEQAQAILKQAERGARKSYARMNDFIHEVEREPYPDNLKRPFLEKLQALKKRRGEEEVQNLIDTAARNLDREGFRKLEEQLKAYEGVDMSAHTETLRQMREAAEKQEITNIVKRSRKSSRKDYVALMQKLENQKFADENVAPYMEKIQEKVRNIDEERINELLDQAGQDFNSLASVYEQLDAESFLPELKTDAMEMLSKRLEKIRTDECELLVHKLQDEMEGKISENARHHFYPARKVMLKRAEPEEIRAIESALNAYATERSRFEYPIFMADTSRNGSGREGMLLTPENLFYSTRMNAYHIPVADIDSIQASTGLLNRKLTLEETNGTKHKLPYAVETGEMQDWAEILEDFIHYLQEKPASRKLPYLAKETHDTICCYRCGYIYRERDVCPECGYKKNR